MCKEGVYWLTVLVICTDTLAMGERIVVGHWRNNTEREHPNTRRKPCHNATLFTTNPRRTGRLNPVLRLVWPNTEIVSHGTAVMTLRIHEH